KIRQHLAAFLDDAAAAFRLETQTVRLAVLAAMAAAVFQRETLFLGLGTVAIGDLAAVLEDNVAALGHAERLLEQPEMIELGAARMAERLEPRRRDEIRHFEAVDQETVLLDRIAHLIGVFPAAIALRPQIGDRI